MKVDILSSHSPPPTVGRRPQIQSERFTKLELERPSWVEGALQGTGRTIALPWGGHSDTGIRYRIKEPLAVTLIIYALSLVQKRTGVTKSRMGSLWHRAATLSPACCTPVVSHSPPSHRCHRKLRISLQGFTHSE
uniref:Uncharacterized protein n=1 Tax=Molossus molossus TaxID=27622 RepID=A0A7J8JVY6_MOLMO|nr:hypothetical protein HJG59_008027 [Molossus molossus]